VEKRLKIDRAEKGKKKKKKKLFSSKTTKSSLLAGSLGALLFVAVSPGTCSRISRSVADRRLPSLVGLSTLVMYERIVVVVVVVGVEVVGVGERVQRTASDLVWCGMRLKPSPLNTARAPSVLSS
jgi:hypothetical protein